MGHLHKGIIKTNPSCAVDIYFEIRLAMWPRAGESSLYVFKRVMSTAENKQTNKLRKKNKQST